MNRRAAAMLPVRVPVMLILCSLLSVSEPFAIIRGVRHAGPKTHSSGCSLPSCVEQRAWLLRGRRGSWLTWTGWTALRAEQVCAYCVSVHFHQL
jgi:hypothetical protein